MSCDVEWLFVTSSFSEYFNHIPFVTLFSADLHYICVLERKFHTIKE